MANSMTEVPPTRIAFLGQKIDGTGNLTTVQRILSFFSHSNVQYEDRYESLVQPFDVLIVVHALHFYDAILKLETSVRLIVILGGTDVNCCLQDQFKRKLIKTVLERASAIVCFNTTLAETIEREFGELVSSKSAVIPQAVSVDQGTANDTEECDCKKI